MMMHSRGRSCSVPYTDLWPLLAILVFICLQYWHAVRVIYVHHCSQPVWPSAADDAGCGLLDRKKVLEQSETTSLCSGIAFLSHDPHYWMRSDLIPHGTTWTYHSRMLLWQNLTAIDDTRSTLGIAKAYDTIVTGPFLMPSMQILSEILSPRLLSILTTPHLTRRLPSVSSSMALTM